jgi:hypothetical protein
MGKMGRKSFGPLVLWSFGPLYLTVAKFGELKVSTLDFQFWIFNFGIFEFWVCTFALFLESFGFGKFWEEIR